MNREKDAQAYALVKKAALVPAAGVVIALAAGCVPQDKYDDLLTSYRTLQEQNVQLESDLESARSANSLYQNRVGASGAHLSELEQENNRLRGDLDSLTGDYQALLERLDGMQFQPLPDDVNLALQELADRYPSLLTYDSRLGMVRFASDLTFALGSAELTPAAASSIAEFAKIANADSVRAYELKLVGHTDTVPIRNQATLAKHPTNTHLSVHRAIAVADAVRNNGVAAERIQVAGYGPYRPVVQNGPAGAAENRRVEIFLVPMKGAAAANLPVSAGAGNTATRERAIEEPMK